MGQQWLVWRRAPNTNRTNANANANVREAVSVLDRSEQDLGACASEGGFGSHAI